MGIEFRADPIVKQSRRLIMDREKAFPSLCNDFITSSGMDLRDYFAAQMASEYMTIYNRPVAEVARDVYRFADALMKAREENVDA